MRVDVDEARETGGVRKVDGCESGGKFCRRCGADRENCAGDVKDDDLVAKSMAGANIKKFSAANGAGPGGRERRKNKKSGQNKHDEQSGQESAHGSPWNEKRLKEDITGTDSWEADGLQFTNLKICHCKCGKPGLSVASAD